MPSKMLEIFNSGAMNVVLQIYEHYEQIHDHVFVRIIDLPVSDKLRDIRYSSKDSPITANVAPQTNTS